ncbi:hypothetical protein HL658_02740 [Azospirillum sp. RWY-5-1]|uniref:Uncharacterized protein n=1 Tax=Azospirillum oleiclasticum TaxID=2735135 RepID=A0ABX2T2T2_9PROT|nr:hypothetical protein [Azospirillum oleiclasticum]NYZ11453.1 hypothetical protein [Azospirillum oleiclasticum]NYZ18614.1 hypothetical protein [Azospirillum oleiclasticum]
MDNGFSPISNWVESERAAWVLSAPKWQRMAHVLLGMAVGLIAGLAISHFSG